MDHSKLWKILQEMGIPDHLTCLLRNLYAGQEATRHGKTDWFRIGKRLHQGCILSPCLFNLYAEYIIQNAGLDEVQAGIKIARRNINNLRYAVIMTPWTCGLSVSSGHGISQVRILEWVAISFSKAYGETHTCGFLKL